MTESNEPRELLPCPFCGGREIFVYEDDEIGAWFVQCRSACDASVSGFTRIRAIAKWNHRAATEAASAATAAELREALRHLLDGRKGARGRARELLGDRRIGNVDALLAKPQQGEGHA